MTVMPDDPAVNPGRRRALAAAAAAFATWPRAAFSSAAEAGSVVVYTSHDREFSEPVLGAYEKQSGVSVRSKYDVESTKTVGLAQLLIAEAARPRCDLFWNNEVLNTLRLARRGLLRPFKPAAASAYPDAFKAGDQTWYGFAARARVLLVNTDLVPKAERPATLDDLLKPRWKNRLAIAKPLFGTTATHATCLFAAWGGDRAKAFFRGLKANGARVVSGNKQSAQAVSAGQVALGLTDTDDAVAEVAAGRPVAVVYLDREPGQLGTLFIPNTVAVIKNSPHPEAAESLAAYLLSPAVESALARGPSAQIPLNPAVALPSPSRVETPKTVRSMPVDWNATVDLWDTTAAFLAAEFAG